MIKETLGGISRLPGAAMASARTYSEKPADAWLRLWREASRQRGCVAEPCPGGTLAVFLGEKDIAFAGYNGGPHASAFTYAGERLLEDVTAMWRKRNKKFARDWFNSVREAVSGGSYRLRRGDNGSRVLLQGNEPVATVSFGLGPEYAMLRPHSTAESLLRYAAAMYRKRTGD